VRVIQFVAPSEAMNDADDRFYDVIVVGVGAHGSAAMYQVAKRGRSVLGLEKFFPAHDRGSSHGLSRIIRLVYHEDPSYVPLLRCASRGGAPHSTDARHDDKFGNMILRHDLIVNSTVNHSFD
jgi:flavin-dependent dehydrogenase